MKESTSAKHGLGLGLGCSYGLGLGCSLECVLGYKVVKQA